ncbi:hypothetical protein NLI96_g463 [Meripilus lineatus]|uniref:F-box domain-containing protein n=1 Tax=Meripilus lineatus TaxID=2056292 RepID=A0AAD5VCC3_9APHY|nr:hypothetical protein NLI96_g463 [Physisporinus lineatus]
MPLDFDTQAIVMSHLAEKRDVLAYMRTNHAHYDVGSFRLLQFRIVVNQYRVADFCDFMLSGSIPRLPGLRRITFGGHWKRLKDPTRAHIVDRLVSVLEGAYLLRELHISRFDEFLAIHPKVGSAIASLDHLDNLSICNVAQAHLNHLPSSLVTLDLSFLPNTSRVSTAEDDGANPVIAISTLTPNLEHLTLHHASLDSMASRFPQVRSLTLVEGFSLNTAWIIDTFPRLERLSLKAANSTGVYEAQEHRQVNRTAGRAVETTTLKYLSAKLVDIYSLGFKCGIEELVVTKFSGDQLDMLSEVLNDALPRTLEISISAEAYPSVDFLSLIPSSTRTWLKDLRLNVQFPLTIAVEVQTLKICEMLRTLSSIVSIRLCLYTTNPSRYYNDIGTPDEQLRELKHELLASTLIVAAPSLQDNKVWKKRKEEKRKKKIGEV